jgi:hypothetical protein
MNKLRVKVTSLELSGERIVVNASDTEGGTRLTYTTDRAGAPLPGDTLTVTVEAAAPK